MNTIPILVIFAYKYDANIVLMKIFEILKIFKIENWESYILEHISFLCEKEILIKIKIFLQEFYTQNKFYLQIYEKSNENLRNNSFRIVDKNSIKSSIVVQDFHCFILENIFENDIKNIPKDYLYLYSKIDSPTKYDNDSVELKSIKLKNFVTKIDLLPIINQKDNDNLINRNKRNNAYY